MKNIFFDSWESVVRTCLITVMAYILLILLLRASGKRTLSKMNAFDFIVTIALGSTLATVILNKNVALIDGMLSFSLLIGLQYLITRLSARYKTISSLVKSTPALLVYKGVFLKEIMLKERVDEDEIKAILRSNGLASLQDADAVVLETDGNLTVIPHVENLEAPVIRHTIKPDDLK
jgi:uncharacterized membrane protein YcaP (DUF421 family)